MFSAKKAGSAVRNQQFIRRSVNFGTSGLTSRCSESKKPALRFATSSSSAEA